MTERITQIVARSFRGVPGELVIEFPEGRSLVALGDNGTGKSTIADALEFFFTGQIRFLAREGRAIIQHQSASEDEASVEVETSGSLSGRATLREAVEEAREIAQRENVILSGRTLAEFVDKTKGEKWRYLFDILGLGAVDQLRLDLQQARNALQGALEQARSRRDGAASTLQRDLGGLSETSLLAAIRESCEKAGVRAPASLDEASGREWAPSFAERTKKVQTATKFREVLDALDSPPSWPASALLEAWNRVVGKISAFDRARKGLMEAGNAYLQTVASTDSCPLCGQPIDTHTLRERIDQTLRELQESARAIEGAGRALRKVIEGARSQWAHREGIRKNAATLGVVLPKLPAELFESLQHSLSSVVPVDPSELNQASQRLVEWDASARRAVAEAAPETTPADSEIIHLTRLVDQGRDWQEAEGALSHASRAAELANQLHAGYVDRQNDQFTNILDRISGRVAEIYAWLHPEEELQNVALEGWGEKGVELAVDFHGIRQRPPHGVLSESHLNSLGISLFLAMAETFNRRLGFLVLDDIVNSFDIEHRGRLAELLASQYEATQLVVLTHDHLFCEQIRRRSPAWLSLEFTSWTYDEGPRLRRYESEGLVAKARAALEKDDLQGAATKGRRALEEILQEACEGMRAPVPLRRGFRNDRREPSELFAGVHRGLKKHGAAPEELRNLLKQLEADLQATLNIEAHASPGWASRNEVNDSLDRISQLRRYWTCDECDTAVWTIAEATQTRCRCGRTRFPP